MMIRKYIGIICMAVGVGVCMIPFATEAYEEHQQKQILQAWKDELSVLDETNSNSEESAEPQDETEENRNNVLDKAEVLGVLQIPEIGLEQPVLKGATKDNLALALATVEPTGEPGSERGFSVAGHNSRTYGRHFNRLHEVQDGDEIIMDTGTEQFRYEITDVFIVEADEVWVLEDTLAGAEITLITCYYPPEGKTQRLVVKGLLQDGEGQ